MIKNKKGSIGIEIIASGIFMLIAMLLIGIFSSLENKNNEAFINIQNDKIGFYMENIFFETNLYKIGEINLPGQGLEPNNQYNAICEKEIEKCWPIDGILILGNNIYIYHPNEFGIFTQEEQNFYSLNDLEKLPEEQKSILLDLQEKPRFIFE